MRKILSSTAHLAKAALRPVFGTITHVAVAEPLAALTFDDGPDPVHTPRLLEVLARHHARATFFMVGAAARRYPGLVRQVAGAGHAIGNHSWDHPSFPFISARERRRQIRACAAELSPYGQRLFRPPGGHQTPVSRLDPLWLRHEVIGWSVDPQDYLDRPAGELVRTMVQRIRAGSIILLHDGLYRRPDSDRQSTIDAVEMLLASLGRSYRFETVPALLRRGRPRKVNAFWKPASDPYAAGAMPSPPESAAGLVAGDGTARTEQARDE